MKILSIVYNSLGCTPFRTDNKKDVGVLLLLLISSVGLGEPSRKISNENDPRLR